MLSRVESLRLRTAHFLAFSNASAAADKSPTSISREHKVAYRRTSWAESRGKQSIARRESLIRSSPEVLSYTFANQAYASDNNSGFSHTASLDSRSSHTPRDRLCIPVKP